MKSTANYIWSTNLQSEQLRRDNRSKSASAVSHTQLMPWFSCDWIKAYYQLRHMLIGLKCNVFCHKMCK